MKKYNFVNKISQKKIFLIDYTNLKDKLFFNTKNLIKNLKNLLNKILKNNPLILFIFTKIFQNLNLSARAQNSDFPIQKKGILGFNNYFYKGKKGYFYLRFYNTSQKNLFFLSTFYNLVKKHLFAYEIFEAKEFSKYFFKKFNNKNLKIVGISHFARQKQNFRIKSNINEYDIFIEPERFSYLKFSKNIKTIKISSTNKFLVSENYEKKIKKNPRLVMTIFIDGFNYIKDSNYLKKIAPNTFDFFNNNGHIFNKHFSNAEWTLPSFASLLTGKYTHNHGIFHPDANHDVGHNNKLMPEYFQDAGYFTFMCNSGWRSSPSYGYVKGFDRTIYKKDANAKYIIGETLDHLCAFNDANNFCFLGLNDLHHFLDITPPLIMQSKFQNNQIYKMKVNKINLKSVEKSYDINSVKKLELKTYELDCKLKLLYDFVKNNYPKNHLISIITDHGHAYLSKSPHILSHYRTSIPWLIKSSKKIEYAKYRNFFTSNIDVLPTLLDLSDLSSKNLKIDGKSIFQKSFSDSFLIESIFPNKNAYFKFLINNKFLNVNANVKVDYFGRMTINKIINSKNIFLKKIIDHWNNNFLLNKQDF